MKGSVCSVVGLTHAVADDGEFAPLQSCGGYVTHHQWRYYKTLRSFQFKENITAFRSFSHAWGPRWLQLMMFVFIFWTLFETRSQKWLLKQKAPKAKELLQVHLGAVWGVPKPGSTPKAFSWSENCPSYIPRKYPEFVLTTYPNFSCFLLLWRCSSSTELLWRGRWFESVELLVLFQPSWPQVKTEM